MNCMHVYNTELSVSVLQISVKCKSCVSSLPEITQVSRAFLKCDQWNKVASFFGPPCTWQLLTNTLERYGHIIKMLSWVELTFKMIVSLRIYDTIRCDSVYLPCSKELTGSQLSLPHGTNKKLKCETKNKMMSVIGPVQSHCREAVE